MRKVAILLVMLLAMAAPATTAEAMAPGARTSFADGIWRVGNRGIKPGLYRTPGRAGCYWAILEDFRGGIVDNGLTRRKAPQIVEIVRSDAGFESRGRGTWTRQ